MTPHTAKVSPSTTRVPPSEKMAHPWMRISGFGLRQSDVEARGGGHVSCQADYLICVGIGGSDGRHKADSPSHAIPKISGILDAAV